MNHLDARAFVETYFLGRHCFFLLYLLKKLRLRAPD